MNKTTAVQKQKQAEATAKHKRLIGS